MIKVSRTCLSYLGETKLIDISLEYLDGVMGEPPGTHATLAAEIGWDYPMPEKAMANRYYVLLAAYHMFVHPHPNHTLDELIPPKTHIEELAELEFGLEVTVDQTEEAKWASLLRRVQAGLGLGQAAITTGLSAYLVSDVLSGAVEDPCGYAPAISRAVEHNMTCGVSLIKEVINSPDAPMKYRLDAAKFMALNSPYTRYDWGRITEKDTTARQRTAEEILDAVMPALSEGARDELLATLAAQDTNIITVLPTLPDDTK